MGLVRLTSKCPPPSVPHPAVPPQPQPLAHCPVPFIPPPAVCFHFCLTALEAGGFVLWPGTFIFFWAKVSGKEVYPPDQPPCLAAFLGTGPPGQRSISRVEALDYAFLALGSVMFILFLVFNFLVCVCCTDATCKTRSQF